MRSYRILEQDDARDTSWVDRFTPRVEDVDEWEAASGSRQWDPMLRYFIKASDMLWIGLDDEDTPIVIAGVTGVLVDPVGVPWMIGSPGMLEYSRPFLRQSRRFIHFALATYPVLCNYVSAENHSAVVWLRWLRFQVDRDPVPYGPFGAPFHRFSLEA